MIALHKVYEIVLWCGFGRTPHTYTHIYTHIEISFVHKWEMESQLMKFIVENKHIL